MNRSDFNLLDRELRRRVGALNRQGRFEEARQEEASLRAEAGAPPLTRGLTRAFALTLTARRRRRGELPPAGIEAHRAWIRKWTTPPSLP